MFHVTDKSDNMLYSDALRLWLTWNSSQVDSVRYRPYTMPTTNTSRMRQLLGVGLGVTCQAQ